MKKRKEKRKTRGTFYAYRGESPYTSFPSFFLFRSVGRESDGGNAVTVEGLIATRVRERGRRKDIRLPRTMSAINAARYPFDVNQTASEYAPLPHWPRLPFVAL